MTDPRLNPKLWAPYVDDIKRGCLALELPEDPALVTAIGLRETWLGTCRGYEPKGPNGRGDGGHGRGLFQIDDRHEFKTLIPADGADWPVSTQAWCAGTALAKARIELALFAHSPLFERAVACRYNSSGVARCMIIGVDPDLCTTKGWEAGVLKPNYGSDVLRLRDALHRLYPDTFPRLA